jgi:hypothetical protein
MIKLAFLKNPEINEAPHYLPITPCLRKAGLIVHFRGGR